MKLLFVDTSGWDYDVASPYTQPLGGSQSALCYLATELARRGHQVILLTGTTRPGVVQGVTCHAFGRIPEDLVKEHHDAVIFLNCASASITYRKQFVHSVPFIFWNQHASDQPAVQDLALPEVRSGWDAIVCVSDWHRETTIARFGLDPARVFVQRNAISPAFERLFADPNSLVQAKQNDLCLAYTSTPYRGLDVLIDVFPEVHREFPQAVLRIFSSMRVCPGEVEEPYVSLYARCQATPGVEYVGSVSQSELAQELSRVAVFSYPNTFAETSCIAVMEGMAAGAFVVTSELGALPETTMGYGELVGISTHTMESVQLFRNQYLARLLQVLRRHKENPTAFAAERFDQVQAMNAQCTWSVRASQWEEMIRRVHSDLKAR